jgi:hypothetical protein
MDFIGIILTFLSTALITISRLISDKQRAMRNYLVYVGLLVSGAAVFVTYQNVQSQKEKLRKSNEASEKFKQEITDLKLKMFALNGQINEATTSLLQNNDAASIAIAEKLKNSTGELLSANYSTSSVVNDLLKEQNDSLTKILVKAVNVIKQSIAVSESNTKNQLKEIDASFKHQLTTTESSMKIEFNNLEEHVDEKFEEVDKKIGEMEEDSSSSE